MNPYFEFHPDLIIEATGVCDRACVGCYAPNVVSKESAQELYFQRPDLFLSTGSLKETFAEIHLPIHLVTLRGGEPTRHPQLPSLVRICHDHAKLVIIETHGRWLLGADSLQLNNDFLRLLKETKTIIKVSFDKMHGLAEKELRAITTILDQEQIAYLVAITENSFSDFLITRSRCEWINDEKIIFQKKATKLEELIKPQYGVIGTNGIFKRSLHVRTSFKPNQHMEIA